MLKKWFKKILFFAIYFLVGKLAIKIHWLVGYYPMIWFPSGVGLGILVIAGESYWPVVFTASFALCFSEHLSLISSLSLATISAFESSIGALFLNRFSHDPHPKLTTIRENLIFIIFVMGAAALMGSALAVSELYLVGRIPIEKLYFTWRIWWFSAAMSDLVIGATIICLVNDIRFRVKHYWSRRLEFIFLLAIIATASTFIYTILSEYNDSSIIKPYFLFPLMIWITIRFDTLGAISSNLIVMITMLLGAIEGVVPMAPGSLEDRMFLHQLVAMTLGMTGFALAAAIREKEEALDAKSEFINIASHELKTPITSLKLQFDMFDRKLKNKDKILEADTPLFLKKIGRQIQRLTLTVEQLLNTTRFEQGSFQLNVSQVKLSALIKNVLDGMSADFVAARSELKFEMKRDLAACWDSFRMEQVLNNILSNAIKYAPGKPIEVNVTGEKNWAHIVIRDQGPGIDPSKQAQIFKRFIRATDPRKTEGLGLGLFIARRIVEAHGGNIGVTSVVGSGSTFEINVPLAPLTSPHI